MAKCAIMQPTYFPWAGFFSLINSVDYFVFLDNVQYERGTWQNRNRVLVNGEPRWLTVPATRKFLGQAINETEIDEKQNWRQKHLKMLSNAYARHPYAAEMLQAAKEAFDLETANLSELNVWIISGFAKKLGTKATLLKASDLCIPGGRTERLINICNHLDCGEYISPVGAAQYLADDGFVQKTSIRLSFNNFYPAPYPQFNAPAFVSHMSILDVIANLGWNGAAEYIRG